VSDQIEKSDSTERVERERRLPFSLADSRVRTACAEEGLEWDDSDRKGIVEGEVCGEDVDKGMLAVMAGCRRQPLYVRVRV
jgi:hypothetical protein